MTTKTWKDRFPSIEGCRLQLLLDPRPWADDLRERIGEWVAGGVDLFQLRMKDVPTAERVTAAQRLLGLLARHAVPLLINDDVEAAAALAGDVAGVHLGQGDTPVESARARLGPEAWIGLSTHSRAEVVAGLATSATHFGVGACFPTRTKLDPSPLPRAELSAAAAVATRPLFAIGGITPGNVAEVVALGARRIAVSRALLDAADPRSAAQSLRRALDPPRGADSR